MKITSIMATGLAMHQCAPINQPGSATECTRTHDALKQFPSKCGVRMQLEKKLQHTRSKSRPSAAPASISNIVGTAVGSAVTYYSTAPFGLHAALNNRRTIKNTATEFLFVGAVGATAGTIFTDKNTFVTQSLRGYLAGSGAIIGCAIGENIHKTLGLNTNVGCLAGSASSSYILDMQAPNFAWDFFKLGLINLALSGTEYYCLSLKKKRIEIALSRMMELTDPFLRHNIDTSPGIDESAWINACQKLDDEIKKDNNLSQSHKDTLANITDALRKAKNSNDHLQIKIDDADGSLRNMNEHEYMLIANSLGSLLRMMRVSNEGPIN